MPQQQQQQQLLLLLPTTTILHHLHYNIAGFQVKLGLLIP